MQKATLRNDTAQICSLGREGRTKEGKTNAKAPSQEVQHLVEQRGHLCSWSPGIETETSPWMSLRCPQPNVPHIQFNAWSSPESLSPLGVSVSMMPPLSAQPSFSFTITAPANHQILPTVPCKILRIIPLGVGVMHAWGYGVYRISLYFSLNS